MIRTATCGFGGDTIEPKSFSGGSVVKDLPADPGAVGDDGSILGSERYPGVGNGNLLQYSCLENFIDRGA